MKLSARFVGTIVALAWSATALAATYRVSEALSKEFTIDPDGTVTVENLVGNIEIIGVDTPTMTFTAQKTVSGGDDSALAEGRELTVVQLLGDNKARFFRTLIPAIRSGRWSSTVSYTLRVPRGVAVNVGALSCERIRIAGMNGAVRAKTVNGAIVLENTSGAVTADSSNGNILFDSAARPFSNAHLSTVNGEIQVHVPGDSSFQWIATTLRGELMTNLPVRGRFESATYRASVNASRGPTITTSAMMGSVFLLKKGSAIKQARSVRRGGALPNVPQVAARALQKTAVDGPFTFKTRLGNISVGQVRGSANIETGAGEVQLGAVLGECSVVSRGGPLSLGDVFGTLTARTIAGDILVNAARAGGTISTGGGMIRVVFAGGPINLRSEGGDLIVRQAMGSVIAETRSGDVTANINGTVRTALLNLKTEQGSVTLGLGPQFGADIDATVVTSDPDANGIRSDFGGLSVRREQVGNKVRIRAFGKINGGGEKVELYAEDGDIVITMIVPGVLSPMAY